MSQTLAEMLTSAPDNGPAFRLTCWGSFAISCTATGTDLRPRGKKARALVAYLALHPGKAISRERLTGLLWGDRGEEQARASLRQAIAELKNFTGAVPPLIIVDRESLTLNPTQLGRDIDAIAKAVGNHDTAALALLRPDDDERLFANLDDIDEGFDSWLAVERTRQDNALAALINDRAAGPAASGPIADSAMPGTIGPTSLDTEVRAAAVAGRPLRRRLLVVVAGLTAFGGVAAAGMLWFRPLAPTVRNEPLAIAVLPFVDLSPDDQSYFAQGVSEEILGQLARNPRLKVLGRTSAWSLQGEKLDASAIGEKLGVDYLVEGSVRGAGRDVRIDVALVRTRDGARLWSERYAGRLDDMLSMQDRIGTSVASRLSRNSGLSDSPKATGDGEAYRLTLAARAMLREFQPARTAEAIAMLRRAVAIDPNSAPAWAALGTALLLAADQPDSLADLDIARVEARRMANKALALDPQLAAGHSLLGDTTLSLAERRRHREAAARLAPDDAENWLDLAFVYQSLGEYTLALGAFRKAVAIDPLWWPAFYNAAEYAWGMGFPEEAAAYVRRVEAGGMPQPFKTHMARADMAWRRADFSAEYTESKRALAVALPENRYFAELGLARTLRAVGRYADARRVWHFYSVDETMWRMWQGTPPDAAAIDQMVARPAASSLDWSRLRFMLRTLLRAGRTEDVVRLCNSRFGSPAALHTIDGSGPITHLGAAAHCALGWRAQGRETEVAMLLDAVARRSDATIAQGRVPRWYYPYRAQLLAVMGNRDAALEALETAVGMGWFYAEPWSFADIADEPAYASIRNTPRFQTIRTKLNADVARERREIDAMIEKSAARPTI